MQISERVGSLPVVATKEGLVTILFSQSNININNFKRILPYYIFIQIHAFYSYLYQTHGKFSYAESYKKCPKN